MSKVKIKTKNTIMLTAADDAAFLTSSPFYGDRSLVVDSGNGA
jgi:hypothetical protein